MNVVDYLFGNTKNLEKEFVLGPKEQASFNLIYKNSIKLADYLRSVIGENEKIILISANSVYFITAYLAIMKSGNVCVPLNPAIEKENLDYILNQTESSVLFTTDKLKDKFDFNNVRLYDEKRVDLIIRNSSAAEEESTVDFDYNRLAQILFTSGSTGIPKGVMLSHKNLIANTDSIIEYLKLTANDIMEVVLPFYYCYGLSLLHTHLKAGGSVVLNNSFTFLGSVISDLNKYKCTGFAGVPSHFQILLRKSKSFTKTDFPHLKYFTQAGGKLHNVFIKEIAEAFPDKKFYVMYGQTEATARLSYLPSELVLKKLGSIGKGIPNVKLQVLNEMNLPVKPGEVGEIVAAGNNIMLGYLNDIEDTSAVLKDGNLFTGDLATVDEDGFIYLVTRKKEILKVGGKRISPKEIEEVIVSIPEVVDCTIEGVFNDVLGEAIKATVVLKDDIDKNEAEKLILSACRKKLAIYKIPQIIRFQNNLTVNEAGKKVRINSSVKLK